MNDEAAWLERKFKQLGGRYENLLIVNRYDRGFGCDSINKAAESIIFCPEQLLVDINDVGLSPEGLYLDNTEKYGDNAEFLNRYLAFHFNYKTLDSILALKAGIESIADVDRALLKRVNLPLGHGDYSDDESFIINRIKQSHCLECKITGNKLIMPFVSFLNHDKEGVPFERGNARHGSGVRFSGKFDGEAFAFYNDSDPLAIFTSYGFVGDARYVYSLPMVLRVAADRTLRIERNLINDSSQGGDQRWPAIRVEGSEAILSWFPLYCENGPLNPAKLSATLARQLGISGEQLLYMIIRHNLSVLFPIAFQLNTSDNSYCRRVSDCAKKQLELISRPLIP